MKKNYCTTQLANSFLFTLLIVIFSFSSVIAQQVTPWEYNEDCNSLINTGIAAMTCGVTETVPAGSQYTFGFVNINGALPAVGRIDVSAMQDMYHHPDYDITQLGNVFGLTMDDCGYTYVCATSNYGAAFFGQQGISRYGDIGGGAEDLNAAGTIYIIDKETAAPSVWAVLPQQASNFTHATCEGGTPVNRNTGPGIGNICYHKDNRNFYASNFEDSRIYRLDDSGQILDSYDPLTYDSGVAGVDNLNDLAYGLAVSPDGTKLFFGTVGSSNGPFAMLYSVDLNIDGSFVGSVDNTYLPVGATWDNYVGADLFHYSVDPGYAFQDTYFLSDLEFAPNDKLLLGVRMGCGNTIASSYNHYGKTEVVSLLGGLYSNFDGEIITSGPFSLAGNDAYGGVGLFNNPNGGIEYLISSGDMLMESGPHGICTVPAGVFGLPNDPAAPSGIISYGPPDMNDPKGIGGDVQVFIECFCQVEECLEPTDTLDASFNTVLIGDCIADSIQFSNTTAFADSLVWDFGDASPLLIDETNPIHNYLMPGTYTVTLIATEHSGCFAPDTTELEVMIGELPIITAGFNYNATVDCDSLTIFTSNISDLADTYVWDFGDGSPLVFDESPSHIYDELGDITITLIASDSQGCAEPDTIIINDNFTFTGGMVIPVSFTATEDNECETLTADFTNTSTLGDTYEWDFGDDSAIDNTENPTHIYTEPGSYTVTLTVSDSSNCNESNTETYIIDYSGPINAELMIPFLESCLDAPVQFTTEAIAPYYEWMFGDDNFSTEQNPLHQYEEEGTYNVSLTVIDSATCNISSTANADITISTAADANFIVPDTIIMLNQTFTVNYPNADNVNIYIWNFGDGTPVITNEAEVEHFYNQNGEYDICLSIETEAGCTNEYCQKILVDIEAAIGVPNAFSPNSDSANDILFVKGYNIEWFNFKLFNRWGELVFETEDLTIGWDGVYNSENHEMDVFAYLLNARLLDGTSVHNQTGNVTLLR